MVTLDIEDTCIKIMTVRGKQVDLAISRDIEPGLVEDSVIMDRKAVGQIVKQLMSDNKIGDKKVVAGISGIHSIYRVVRLPKLPVRLHAEAANREMSRVMPVPLNEVYTSWQAVDVSDDETAFCLVGLPRNSVDAMLDTLREAGLESKLMDVKPLAVARLTDESDALVINVQPVSFDIVLILGGIPELLRSITFPGRDTASGEKIELIKEELERTITFYNSSHKSKPITEDTFVFISGEHHQLLVEQLNYKVKPIPQFLLYPEGFSSDNFAVNIGLVLKQIKTSGSRISININTVPEIFQPRPRAVFEVVWWALVGIFAIVIVFTVMKTAQELRLTSSLQKQVDIAQTQVQKRQGTTEEVEKYRQELTKVDATLNKIQKPLDTFTSQREKVNSDLSKITSLLPGTINLTSITYEEKAGGGRNKEEKTWEIGGNAPDEATILDYSNDLRKTGRFQLVTVSTAVVEYNEVSFTINLTDYGN